MIIKADLKHWWTRVTPVGKVIDRDYNLFADQVAQRLGVNGCVAVFNARGIGHKNGPDYRFETLCLDGETTNNEIETDRGRGVFYDSKRKIYFLKGRQFSVKNGGSLVVLGLPLGENLEEGLNVDEILRRSKNLGAICGINPSEVGLNSRVVQSLFPKLDFVVVYSAFEETAGRGVGELANNCYYRCLDGDCKTGRIAVSGGHRAQRFLGASVGAAYTKLEIPDNTSVTSFTGNLRTALRGQMREENLYRGKVPRSEVIRHGICSNIDRIFY